LSERRSQSAGIKDQSETPAPYALHSATLILEHLDLTLSYYGERAGVPLFRKHLAWYAAGRAGAATFRVKINTIADANEIRRAIKEFFSE